MRDKESSREIQKQIGLERQFRAVCLAVIHMREARDAASHLFGLQNASNELRHSITTGMIVSYTRSFGSNTGLSSINRKFCEFTDEELGEMHKALLVLRDKLYAHHDATFEAEKLHQARSESPQRVEIDVRADGSAVWSIRRGGLPRKYLQAVVKLCEFQLSRLEAESLEMLARILDAKKYSVGTHNI